MNDKPLDNPQSSLGDVPPQGIGPAQEMPEGFGPLIQQLDQLQGRVHDVAIGMGRWEDQVGELELHSEMHVDLAKATVSVQQGLPLYNFKELEPTGELVELADCALHIMDYFASLGISMAQIMVRKYLHDARMLNRKRAQR